MKTTQRGFVLPLLLIIVALLLAGGGAYMYTQTKQANPPVSGSLPVATSTVTVTNQTVSIGQVSKNYSISQCGVNLTVKTTQSVTAQDITGGKYSYLEKWSYSVGSDPKSNIQIECYARNDVSLAIPKGVSDYLAVQSDGSSEVNKSDYSVFDQQTMSSITKLYSAKNRGYREGSETIGFETKDWMYTFSFLNPEQAKNQNTFVISVISPVTQTTSTTPSVPVPTVSTDITVTYPNGGEKLDVNEQDSMPKGFNFVTRWTSNNLTRTTNIYLISATDGSVCLLGSAPVNQGSFGAVLGASFKCKNTSKLLTSGQYKVRLIADTQSSSSDLGVNDMSDNYFTLNVVSTNPQTMPKISSIEVVEGLPTGSVYAGQTAEIFGTNLRGVVSIKIGEQTVPVMTGLIADRSLDTDQAFKVPSLPAGVYNVSVTNSSDQVSNVYPVTVVVYSPR